MGKELYAIGVCLVAFVAWWTVRHGSNTPLFPMEIVLAYLVTCLAITVATGCMAATPSKAAMAAGLSSVAFAAVAIGLLSMPSPAMMAVCRRPQTYCEDFSGAILMYGFWLVALVCASVAALVGIVARKLR